MKEVRTQELYSEIKQSFIDISNFFPLYQHQRHQNCFIDYDEKSKEKQGSLINFNNFKFIKFNNFIRRKRTLITSNVTYIHPDFYLSFSSHSQRSIYGLGSDRIQAEQV